MPSEIFSRFVSIFRNATKLFWGNKSCTCNAQRDTYSSTPLVTRVHVCIFRIQEWKFSPFRAHSKQLPISHYDFPSKATSTGALAVLLSRLLFFLLLQQGFIWQLCLIVGDRMQRNAHFSIFCVNIFSSVFRIFCNGQIINAVDMLSGQWIYCCQMRHDPRMQKPPNTCSVVAL